MKISIRALVVALITSGVLTWPISAIAQSGCGSDGYRVISRRWDALLGTGRELRQNCTHPEWPVRSILMGSGVTGDPVKHNSPVPESKLLLQPLLVHAGDTVRLWQQDEKVRIEMYGVAEQSAREAERTIVRVLRQHGEEGTSVERIAGVVRATGDVEMER